MDAGVPRSVLASQRDATNIRRWTPTGTAAGEGDIGFGGVWSAKNTRAKLVEKPNFLL
jgi:hypothetical protein